MILQNIVSNYRDLLTEIWEAFTSEKPPDAKSRPEDETQRQPAETGMDQPLCLKICHMRNT